MTSNSEARKRHEERDAQDCAICHSTEHAPGWHFTDTVTVTIRREDAEQVVIMIKGYAEEWLDDGDDWLADIFLAALDAER